jgi:Fe-S-cluster containining protein
VLEGGQDAAMPLPVVTDTPLRFSCARCGECCRAWTVPVDVAHIDAHLRGVDWVVERSSAMKAAGVGQLMPPQPGTGRCVMNTSVGETLDCVFLGEGATCSIHARIGEAAKPPACRQFPFHFVRVDDRIDAFLDPTCHAVARGIGEPVPAPSLVEIAESATIETLPEQLLRAPGVPLSRADYDALRAGVAAILRSTAPVETRLRDAWAAVRGKSVRPGGDALGRRLLLALLLLLYRNAWNRKAIRGDGIGPAFRRAAALLRLAAGVLMGGGRLPIEARGVVVNAGDVDAKPWNADAPAVRPTLDRWLGGFAARHELAPDASRGIAALLTTYFLASFFARAVAKGEPGPDDVASGIQFAEKVGGSRMLAGSMRGGMLGSALRQLLDGDALPRWVLRAE